MTITFKNIRRKLARENKVKSYLRYATGEIVLVVIGILIALQVNNWNEARKLNIEREALVKALISDFKATHARLANAEQEDKKYIERTSRFLALSYKDNEDTPVDVLKYNLSGAFEYPSFEPILSSYNQAVSTGKIGLIKNKEFLSHMAEFLSAYNFYKMQTDISGQIFYIGSIWEVRKKIGNLVSLAGESRSRGNTRKIVLQAYKFSDKEYRDFIKKPEVFAAIDNMQTIFYNDQESFQKMDKEVQLIIRELEK